MRELDGYAQELIMTASKEAVYLIDNLKDMDSNVRMDKLKYFMTILTETLKRGEEKVALAKSTFDTIDRHCNRLDADLVKVEEEQALGSIRITNLPGQCPSARNLKSGSTIREPKRTEIKVEKKIRKRKTMKDTDESSSPARTQSKLLKTTEKTKTNKGGRSKTVVPHDMPIDPNEPLYCYCQQVSFGEMVACDNQDGKQKK
ncbi:hypothetical protein G6F56_008571 [Rhizopus delemar]|nr:hypothetical protein G6F56_008571 [Rhizopus delemar]